MHKLIFNLAAALMVAFFIFLATCSPAQATDSINQRVERVEELVNSILLRLGGDRVAVCLPVGVYTEGNGVPLYCFKSSVPALDSISQVCQGVQDEDGRMELICDADAL